MAVKIGVVMDPIEGISFKKDSTLAMLWAAQQKGWEIWYMEQHHLFSRDGVAQATMAPLEVFMDSEKWFEREDYQTRKLSEHQLFTVRLKIFPIDWLYRE